MTTEAPKKVRYAAQEDAGAEPLSYHSDFMAPGQRVPWRDSEDNPMSPAFKPVNLRGERAKARWWAMHGKKNLRPVAGQFDA